MVSDVILAGGRVLEPGVEDDARKEAVAQITAAASFGRRVTFDGRGWRAESDRGAVAQIPVRASSPDLLPSVAVLVPVPSQAASEVAIEQILDTAKLAGYSADRATVSRQMSTPIPRPKGLFARLVAWFQSLFKRGVG